MKTTVVVVALVATAGILAFMGSGDDPETAGGASKDAARPALDRRSSGGAGAAAAQDRPSEASDAAAEAKAVELVSALGKAERARDREAMARIEQSLRKDAWETEAAREWALDRGTRLERHAQGLDAGDPRIRYLHEARRYLSRGLWLPRLFDAQQRDTKERADLKARLEAINQEVMTWLPGVKGVTAPYVVPSGILPVQIVARKGIVQPEPLPMGPNAILHWNQGSLDPKRMRAGSRFVLPLEPLTVQVHQERFRLAIYLGEWFVKEWMVGIGAPRSPTPRGTFLLHSKQKNPDWYAPNGRVIPAGDAENELGTAWIAIHGKTLPLSRGIGIHGTNKPDTVGTRCSNGCVRLLNEHVDELYWWMRTGNGGGQATRVFVR